MIDWSQKSDEEKFSYISDTFDEIVKINKFNNKIEDERFTILNTVLGLFSAKNPVTQLEVDIALKDCFRETMSPYIHHAQAEPLRFPEKINSEKIDTPIKPHPAISGKKAIEERRIQLYTKELENRVLKTGEFSEIPEFLEVIMHTLQNQVEDKGYNINLDDPRFVGNLLDKLNERKIKTVQEAKDVTMEYVNSISNPSQRKIEEFFGVDPEEDTAKMTRQEVDAVKKAKKNVDKFDHISNMQRAGKIIRNDQGDHISKGNISQELKVFWDGMSPEKKTRHWVYKNTEVAIELMKIIELAADIEDERLSNDPLLGGKGIRSNRIAILQEVLDEISDKRIWKQVGGINRAIKYGEKYLMARLDLTKEEIQKIKDSSRMPQQKSKQEISKIKKYITIAAAVIGGFLGGTILTKTGDLETKLRNSRNQLKEIKEEKDELANKYSSAESKRKQVRENLELISKRYDEMLDKYDKSQEELKSTNENKKILGKKLENRQDEIEEARNKLEKTKEELDKLAENYNKELKENDYLKEQIKENKDKLVQVRKEKKELEDEYKERLANSEAKTEEARNKLQEKANQYNELLNNYQNVKEKYNIKNTETPTKTIEKESAAVREQPKKLTPIEDLLFGIEGNPYEVQQEVNLYNQKTKKGYEKFDDNLSEREKRLNDIERKIKEAQKN